MDYIDMFLDAFKAVHSPKVDQVVVRALMMRDGRISPTVIKSPQVIVVNKNSDKGLLFELPGGAITKEKGDSSGLRATRTVHLTYLIPDIEPEAAMAELKGRCILLADIAIIENTLMEQKMKELTLGALRKQHGRVIHRESGWKYFRNDGLHLRMKAEQEALGLERQESEQSQPSEHLPSSGLPRGDQMPMEIWTNPRGKLYNGFEKVLRSVDGNPEQTPKTADQLAVIEKYSTWRDGQCGCTIDWSAARQSS